MVSYMHAYLTCPRCYTYMDVEKPKHAASHGRAFKVIGRQKEEEPCDKKESMHVDNTSIRHTSITTKYSCISLQS